MPFRWNILSRFHISHCCHCIYAALSSFFSPKHPESCAPCSVSSYQMFGLVSTVGADHVFILGHNLKRCDKTRKANTRILCYIIMNVNNRNVRTKLQIESCRLGDSCRLSALLACSRSFPRVAGLKVFVWSASCVVEVEGKCTHRTQWTICENVRHYQATILSSSWAANGIHKADKLLNMKLNA